MMDTPVKNVAARISTGKNARNFKRRVTKKRSSRRKKYDEEKEREKDNVTEEIYHDYLFFGDDTLA